jgi:curved DNA-binding protein CbpA
MSAYLKQNLVVAVFFVFDLLSFDGIFSLFVAFSEVKTAYECLSDDQKRAHYDRYGQDEDSMQAEAAASRASAYAQHGGMGGGHYYQEEFTAEDLFAAFFGGQCKCVCVLLLYLGPFINGC